MLCIIPTTVHSVNSCCPCCRSSLAVSVKQREFKRVATRYSSTPRASATTVVERTASVILPAGGPRIAPTAHRGTKPQMPCSDEFRSASLSYRPTLATAAFCNPIAPAHSCRDVRSLIPPTSPTPTVRAAPPFFGPIPYFRDIFAYIQGGFCTTWHYVPQITKYD